ncbi:MAG: hypothetical protein RLZZ524_1047 [Pseudomonadota bacterium]
MPQPDAAKIAACIRSFADATSSRGIWQHERKLAEQLGGRAIDLNTAAAARRIGEWLRTQPGRAA